MLDLVFTTALTMVLTTLVFKGFFIGVALVFKGVFIGVAFVFIGVTVVFTSIDNPNV